MEAQGPMCAGSRRLRFGCWSQRARASAHEGAGPHDDADQRDGVRQREAVARELAKFLLAHERVMLASRPHPVQFLGPLAVAAVSLGASALLMWMSSGWMSRGGDALSLMAIVCGVWGVAALASAIWSAMSWRWNRLFVTNHRIGWTHGVINRNTSSTPNRHVTSIDLQISPLGWLLGYGCIRIERAGHRPGGMVLPLVKHPEATLRVMMSVVPPGAIDEDADA